MNKSAGRVSGKAAGRAWPWWAEALLVGMVTWSAVQEAYVAAGGTLASPRVVPAAVLGLSVALRYRWPVPAAVCATAGAAGLGSLFPLLIVVFHLASRGRLVLGAASAAAAMAAGAFTHPQQSLWATRSYGPLAVLLVALAFGLWADSRRRLVSSLAGQVDHLRVERELRAEGARLEERTRIAAEMHDVLAHRLTVIALHTGALQRRGAALPGPVADRISLLRTASTEALDDLRDVLGALRRHGPAEATDAREPGLRALSTLLDEARAAGQEVDTLVEGDAEAVPASHRLAVHRLVQEALTNARKHAAGARVRVEVHYGPPESTVVVRNPDGERSEVAAAGSGYGLVGLAERVDALGGRLAYGPTGAGGWEVTAGIPQDSRRSEGAA
ncbi:sensor histidine kinase [Streptomyces roseoverticillatus]|uniref:sensor histidine kinase n=1 Tax=Streptomyces roseoverticillatus TaxID=66429 RepID=UPI000AF46AD6|nr:histidine kinase [Streptomyces roseoverticillatus]